MITGHDINSALGRLNAHFDQHAADDEDANKVNAAISLAEAIGLNHADFSAAATSRAMKAAESVGIKAEPHALALLASVWMEGAVVGIMLKEGEEGA